MEARWTDIKVTFETGKHAGKPIEVIMFEDPGYLYWYSKQESFSKLRPVLQKKIRYIVELADSLRIPGYCRECNHKRPRRMIFRMQSPKELQHVNFVCEDCDPGNTAGVISSNPTFNYVDVLAGKNIHNVNVFIEAIVKAYWKKPWRMLTQREMILFWKNKGHFYPKGKIGISL